MSDTNFKAVFFDFGGTLFSYNRVGGGTFNLLQEATRKLGLEVDPAKIGQAYKTASAKAYKGFMSQSYYLHRDLFVGIFAHFARELGGDPTREYLDWFHDTQRELVTTTFELREDCIDTLKALRETGLNVSIVSNIDDDYLQPMVRRAGLDPHLDAWTSSEEAESCKPDSRIYHYACEKAGCAPADVLFVGDSREQDILGARGVGMTTALIQEPGATPPGQGVGKSSEPHHQVEQLNQVLSIVGA